MVNLTSLDLGTNDFSGTIPANLASCENLKALNLARNKLTGQVPETFKNLPSLSYLSLSNCSLSDLSTSLKILQHCRNLTVVVLTMNFHTEQLPSDDHLQFNVLKALLLDLSWNHLTGSIPGYLGNFDSLFYLDLSNNSLSGEDSEESDAVTELDFKRYNSEFFIRAEKHRDFGLVFKATLQAEASVSSSKPHFPTVRKSQLNVSQATAVKLTGNFKRKWKPSLGHNIQISSSSKATANTKTKDSSYTPSWKTEVYVQEWSL
ncbi:hypothetical protein LXL04_029800 [Taraxacum kok-saghyz]